MSDGTDARSQGARAAQAYARTAGLLILISFAAGGFGEGYVPARIIVSGDAQATAANIESMDSLFRWGVAGYLLEAICDIALSAIFYILLKPVSRGLALMAAFFGLVATGTYAVSEMFLFAGPTLLIRGGEYLAAFSPEQINALTMLSVKLFGFTAAMYLIFYGTASVLRGWLIIRSGYLPGIFGALFILGGLAFMARSAALVLAPDLRATFLPALFAPGAILLALWLVVVGVDSRRWQARQGAEIQ